MRIQSINGLKLYTKNTISNSKNFKANAPQYEGIDGNTLSVTDKKGLINIENISDPKVGSKFIITINDPKYDGLKILVKPESTILSKDGDISVKTNKSNPSFSGRVYGSIRRDSNSSCDEKMKEVYRNFWLAGMHKAITEKYTDRVETSKIKDDYNFFIPSDGDGTRYKDITRLQGGMTKPASYIPATLNGQQMSLVQAVLTNFAKTDKLNDGVGFVEVKPAQGSAFAFLEGLRDGTISTEKPLVFSWGDNFSDINVTKLIQEHEQKNSAMTIMSILADENKIKSLGAEKVDSLENMVVTKFEEKPTAPAAIEEYKVKELDNNCISSVGPFVISKQALQMIKDRYTANPQSFKHETKGYDFSSMIITMLVEEANNGNLKDDDGNKLKVRATILPKGATWSDLGAEKDFNSSLKSIKTGGFINLPEEIKDSIVNNIDDDGNITFSPEGRQMLESLKEEYGLEIKNTISYYKK